MLVINLFMSNQRIRYLLGPVQFQVCFISVARKKPGGVLP